MGDTFFCAVRYISKDRDWSVGVMEQGEKGTRTFVFYKGALPKDHERGEKEKKRKNKVFSTGEVFAS